jgi:hypothetical protein
MFVLDPYALYLAIRRLKTVGINEEIETVIDDLWKFSLPFVPLDSIHKEFVIKGNDGKERLIEDWRHGIKNINKDYQSQWLSLSLSFWIGVLGETSNKVKG